MHKKLANYFECAFIVAAIAGLDSLQQEIDQFVASETFKRTSRAPHGGKSLDSRRSLVRWQTLATRSNGAYASYFPLAGVREGLARMQMRSAEGLPPRCGALVVAVR